MRKVTEHSLDWCWRAETISSGCPVAADLRTSQTPRFRTSQSSVLSISGDSRSPGTPSSQPRHPSLSLVPGVEGPRQAQCLICSRASRMAQWERHRTAKPADLSLVPNTSLVAGEPTPTNCALASLCHHDVYTLSSGPHTNKMA